MASLQVLINKSDDVDDDDVM